MNLDNLFFNITALIEGSYVELKEKDVVIYPFGQPGMLVKQILNEQYGIQEKFILDNRLYKYNEKILSFEEFTKICPKHTIVILTATNSGTNQKMETDLSKLKGIDTIVNVLDAPVVKSPEKAEYFMQLRELLSSAKLLPDMSLIRIGKDNDGGYLMVDDFDNCKIAYSFGIAGDVSWDKDIAEKGIDIFQYDPTIYCLPEENDKFHFYNLGIAGEDDRDNRMLSLKTILEMNGHSSKQHMILKMDVEGAEWQFLQSATSDILDQFDQIIFEMHGMTNERDRESIVSALKKLNKTHQLIWLHGNNYARAEAVENIIIPNCLEVLYVNRKKYDFVNGPCFFPHELDQPCQRGVSDFALGNWGE